MRRVKSFLKKHNLIEKAKEQALEFGYKRTAVAAESFSEFSQLVHEARNANLYLDCNMHTRTVFLMEPDAKAQYGARLAERNAAVEAWWERYHFADEETRRLMACGAIE